MNRQKTPPNPSPNKPSSTRPTSSSGSSSTQTQGPNLCGDINDSTKKLLNYRPWLLRPWALFFWFIMPLISIAAIEWVHQTNQRGTAIFREGDQYKTRERIAEFVPTFLTYFVVIFAGFFLFTLDVQVKRMEPFYQMSKPEGEIGWNSLCLDYFRQSIFLTPFTAIYYGHWAVLCSSLTVIIDANILTPLFGRVFVYDDYGNMSMDLHFTYALEGALGLMSLLVMTLAIILERRRSGIPHTPEDLDALIRFTRSMKLQNSLYFLFKDLNDEISEEELNERVGPLRFQIKQRYLDNGESRLDIVLHEDSVRFLNGDLSAGPQKEPNLLSRVWGGLKKTFEWLMNRLLVLLLTRARKRWLWKDNHPLIFQGVPVITVLFLLITLFVIASGQPFWAGKSYFFYSLGERRSSRNTLSTIIHTTVWVQIEKYTTEYERFYRMSRKEGTSHGDLKSTYIWPLHDLYCAAIKLWKSDFKMSSSYVELAVTVGTYASMFFIIAWNSLPIDNYNAGTTFVVCISIMITSQVIMVIVLLLLFCNRRHPFLPRQPITLASNLLYVYATDLVKEDSSPSLNSSGDKIDGSTEIAVDSLSNFSTTEEHALAQNEKSETTPTQEPVISPVEKTNPGNSTFPQTQSESFPPQNLWQRFFTWKHRSPKETKPARVSQYKSTRSRNPIEFVKSKEEGRCTLGHFIGRDGKPHMGIGYLGLGMEQYILSPERQKQVDDGTVMSSMNLPDV